MPFGALDMIFDSKAFQRTWHKGGTKWLGNTQSSSLAPNLDLGLGKEGNHLSKLLIIHHGAKRMNIYTVVSLKVFLKK